MLFKLLVITAWFFGAATSFPDSLRQDFSTFDYRSLKAARSHGDIAKRSDEIVAKTSIELTYVEGMIHFSYSPASFLGRSELLLFTYVSHNARVLSSRILTSNSLYQRAAIMATTQHLHLGFTSVEIAPPSLSKISSTFLIRSNARIRQ